MYGPLSAYCLPLPNFLLTIGLHLHLPILFVPEDCHRDCHFPCYLFGRCWAPRWSITPHQVDVNSRSQVRNVAKCPIFQTSTQRRREAGFF